MRSLSLAVFAFAVEDMNDLESVMTCAKPLASLVRSQVLRKTTDFARLTFDLDIVLQV